MERGQCLLLNLSHNQQSRNVGYQVAAARGRNFYIKFQTPNTEGNCHFRMSLKWLHYMALNQNPGRLQFTHWIGGWVGSRASLEYVKKKILELTPWSSSLHKSLLITYPLDSITKVPLNYLLHYTP
jgi:hypothetical protein